MRLTTMKTLKSIIPGLFLVAFGFMVVAMTNSTAVDNNQPNEVVQLELDLNGTVVDSTDGTPLNKVAVNLERLEEPVITDKEGEFVVEDIAEGETYTISVDHEGYQPYERSFEAVSIEEAAAMEITIALKPTQ
ncbi:Carboxypeptidase regulatory-like domain-containing protein [Gracilimonas mengyeensis]|uniref:Carboxypeptidase regulatory-like domain-containing protein n=2 Tax=Gracilimonas mengyeensis TaxID=1302730 RepID=A0A521DV97_9BACT|nr:Carboxypeptidase regulatory-like domain-containing protein [Gracilimonas mengyeensis]